MISLRRDFSQILLDVGSLNITVSCKHLAGIFDFRDQGILLKRTLVKRDLLYKKMWQLLSRRIQMS